MKETMDSDKVVYLGEFSSNADMLTAEQTAQLTLDDLKKEGRWESMDKVLVIALDDKNGNYDVSFRQCGMSMSDILALLEVLKSVALKHMGY